MRIAYMGSGEFGLRSLRMLREDGHEIVAVVTQPDRPAGRGRGAQPTPAKAFAVEHGLRVVDPSRVNEPAVVAEIRALNAELAVVIAFGQKIGREILEMFPVGIINVHGSLLPHLRGAAPVQWAILRGDEATGITVFRVVEKMDAGPILSQRRTGIKPAETADELHDRLSAIACDALRGAIERLTKDPADPGDPQDETKVTHAPKLSKADGLLDLSQTAEQVECRINGLYSWPGAHCRFVSQSGRSEEVTLARALADDSGAEPTPADQIGVITPRGGFLAGRGEVAVLEIQPQNGKLMSWEAFVNGRHVQPGDRFESKPHPAV